MFRWATHTLLMLVILLEPGWCCCLAARTFAPPRPQPAPRPEPKPSCCHHHQTSAEPPAPHHRQAPSQVPPCPCRKATAAISAVPPAGGGAARQFDADAATLAPDGWLATPVGFTPVPAAPPGAPLAWSATFPAAQDFLRALCVLRC
jgi:hypothetical protein